MGAHADCSFCLGRPQAGGCLLGGCGSVSGAGTGVSAAVNATPGGAGDAIRAVRDGGRFATITSDSPEPDRGITVSSVYVRPDGGQLGALAGLLAAGQLEIAVARSYGLLDAA